MKEVFKKNFAVILAFLLPLVLIVVVALTVYLPSLFVSTEYSFVYSTCVDNGYSYSCGYNYNYNNQKRYSVVNGSLSVTEIDPNQDLDKNGVPDQKQWTGPRLFIYDTKTSQSREITEQEALGFRYSGLMTSPDGITLSNGYDYNGGVFPFSFGSGSYDYYFVKGKAKKKLNLFGADSNRYYYQNGFQFIGWVLNK